MTTKETAASRASDHAFVLPWSARTKELEESEGPYCDYAAFCEWLEAWNERQEPSIKLNIDELDKTSLYIAFFAACAETAADAPVQAVVTLPALPLDQIICGDNCEVMRTLPSESIDLVVTSPPYDDLRTYGGHSWDFYGVAWNLKRLLKPGGVIVWVVNDETKDGSETGTSFQQALHFKDIGLRLHDTMIYEWAKPFPESTRYHPATEYMFVFSKGKPGKVNILKDRKTNGARKMTPHIERQPNGQIRKPNRSFEIGEVGARFNIWKIPAGYSVGTKDNYAFEHPATFPEALARDHILSWSNEGDIVLDPFSGSGTTAKMAKHNGRRFIGIEVNPEYVEISQKRLAQQVLF